MDHSLTTAANTDLDNSELDDYLKNEGQWKSEKLMKEELDLGPILEPADTGKKAPPKGTVVVELSEEEKTVPKELVRDELLGDVVE